jgi:predicted dehydrogenase
LIESDPQTERTGLLSLILSRSPATSVQDENQMNTDEFKRREVSRRQFLGRSAQQAAGVAVGVVGLTAGIASGSTTRSASPNERLGVGIIGVRNQGRLLAGEFAKLNDVDVRSVCDVDESQLAPAVRAVIETSEQVPETVRDFRQLLDDPQIDAVVIATPDHWHSAMTTLACQAGKDVYLESPATHSVEEGALLIEEAHRAKRIVQVGLQQRSGSHFQSAIEFVRSGKLGTVRLAKAWIVHRRKTISRRAEVEAPLNVDYVGWLGPAPARAFQPNRFHFNWRWFWDYGGGELAHWGVHMLDVARWGLKVEIPQRVSAVGGKYSFDDDQETPDALSVQYDFGTKSILWEQRLWSSHGVEGRSSGVAFHGDNGTLVVDRGGWKVYDHGEVVAADSSDLLATHVRDFVDSVRTRHMPAADLSVGVASSNLCHWGNSAYRQGRELRLIHDSSPGESA